MKKYRLVYWNDFQDEYPATPIGDADGDWYDADDVDAEIAKYKACINESADQTMELARLVKFVLDKGDKPMWLSDGWREEAKKATEGLFDERPSDYT